ncbi:MAG: RHS repeat-associated core domain-containing protein [Limisphaerales bacterium]
MTNSYTANNLNEYVSVGQTNYTFDADGNLVKEASPLGTTTYTYSDENRLTTMTSPQGTWRYGYDGTGNRVASTQNGTTTSYVIDPNGFGNVVGEYDSGGGLIAHYDHALGLLSRADAAGSLALYAFDGSGNVQQTVALTGATVGSYAYTPFGGYLRKLEAIPNPFQYVGAAGVTAEPNGLMLMRNRLYDGRAGRFVTADPLRLGGQDLNFYRYAANSPLNYADPVGLFTFPWGGVIGGIIGTKTWCQMLVGGLSDILVGGVAATIMIGSIPEEGILLYVAGVMYGTGSSLAGALVGGVGIAGLVAFVGGYIGDPVSSVVCPGPPPTPPPPPPTPPNSPHAAHPSHSPHATEPAQPYAPRPIARSERAVRPGRLWSGWLRPWEWVAIVPD